MRKRNWISWWMICSYTMNTRYSFCIHVCRYAKEISTLIDNELAKRVLESVRQVSIRSNVALLPFSCFAWEHNTKNDEWEQVEDRFDRKLASWVGKLLPYGDQPVLCYLYVINRDEARGASWGHGPPMIIFLLKDLVKYMQIDPSIFIYFSI
jgi:hypothetical protein